MKKIIVHVRLNGVPGRNELNGIFRYLARKEDWDFRIVQDEAALEAELQQSASGPGRPDGFIISAPVSDEICALVGKASGPTVLLDIHPSRIPRHRENLAFIAANAATNLKVNDVVIHLGVSRRLADQRFHQFQKESILSAITRARVEELKRRLRETDAPIGRITADCGFLNASYATLASHPA